MSNSKLCFICLRPASDSCSDCNAGVWYCCDAHKRLHRNESSAVDQKCFPFEVRHQDTVGRYMVASRAIKAGEIIYSENPIVIGPNPVSKPQCLFCCKKISLAQRCPGCHYPVCEVICDETNIEYHQKNECKILQKLGNKEDLESEDLSSGQFRNTVYEPVLPLRLLLLRETNPDLFAIANTFMDHDEDRKSGSDYWEHSCKTVMEPLAAAIGHKATFQDVARAVGIIEINNYEVFNSDRQSGYRGLYPLTSLLSHSCQPNCRPVISKTGRCDSRCIATVDIEAGEEMTINYVHLHLSTLERRRTLRENWYFDCFCKRCSDPTEFESYLSAMKCQSCSSNVLPINPLDQESDWKCKDCQTTVNPSQVSEIVATLLQEKENVSKTDLQGYFDFMKRCSKVLHENHSIINSTRRWIIPLYCRRTATDAVYKNPTPEMYQKKLEMCQKYLFVLNTTERGLTKNRGKTLFEIADTNLGLANHFYQRGMLSNQLMTSELLKSIELLKESVRCLNLEDENTFEGLIHKAASQLLNRTIDFLQMLK